MTWLDGLAFDATLAWRSLRRDWPSALVSVGMLALALGLNTTVFTVVDAMLFRGFPRVAEGHELVFLQEHDRAGRCCLAFADVAEWQAHATSFEGIAAVGGEAIALRDREGRAMDLRATMVGANVFALLGVAPAFGRDFTADDARPGAPVALLLSHGLGLSGCGARPDVVGAPVQVDGAAGQIIGVMPQGFEFPLAASDGLWMPLAPTTERGLTPGGFTAVGRLRPGVALADARAELEAINLRLAAAYPATNVGLVPTAVDHAQFTSGADARVIWGSVWAAAALVLLIACANVANLSLLRSVGRWSQFGTCLALGSGRQRLVRQLLFESACITLAAAVPAWALTSWGVAAWSAVTSSRYQMVDVRITAGTVAYLAAVATMAWAFVAWAPIARVLHASAGTALPRAGRSTTQGPRVRRLVSVMVSGQMALAVVLLVAAAVLVRSFGNIVGAPTGVRDPASVLVGFLRLPSETYPNAPTRLAFLDRVETRLTGVTGIEQVSWSSGLPVKISGSVRQIEVEGRAVADRRDLPLFTVTTAAPGYFSVLGAALLAGRDFTTADREGTPPVVLVNERFASLQWPGTAAVGQRLRVAGHDAAEPWRLVVGVVANVMGSDPLRQAFQPLVYVPLAQEPPARATFFLARTAGPADRLADVVRAELQALDPGVGLEFFDTLAGTFAFDRDFMDPDHSELGKYSALAPVFALVALLIATIGLVAVTVHAVSQRTREIGVRVAVGASPRHIRRMVVGEGVRPVVAGLAVGLVMAQGVTRVIQSQLVAVSPSDPLAVVVTSVVLLATALAACRIPTRRALRIEPAVALRHE